MTTNTGKKFKTFHQECLDCKLSVRFKISLPDGADDRVSMVRRSWNDCPKCAEVKKMASNVVTTTPIWEEEPQDRVLTLDAPADPVLHGEG